MSEWNGDCPAGWELVTIGDVVVPKVEQGAPSTDFTYIDIGSINNKTKQIESPKGLAVGNKIPSRAQQHVHAGDILVSMTRRLAVQFVRPALTSYDLLKSNQIGFL